MVDYEDMVEYLESKGNDVKSLLKLNTLVWNPDEPMVYAYNKNMSLDDIKVIHSKHINSRIIQENKWTKK